MEAKRGKNFTEREKLLLIEVMKEFVAVIDNKKTDGPSVEAKKQAWAEVAKKYNSASETGVRTEKQLHALYDNLKKKARKNLSDVKSEIYKTGGATFLPRSTSVEERVVALLTPQIQKLSNEFDSSASYCSSHSTSHEEMDNSNSPISEDDAQKPITDTVIPLKRQKLKDYKTCLNDTKKESIDNFSSINNKKSQTTNEDLITAKKLEILEIQRRQELLKLEKSKIMYDLDIELKKILVESAKIDLELKQKIKDDQ